MTADHLMWSSHGLLCRFPLPQRDFVLNVVRNYPEVIDLLFQCGLLPRTKWYPESETNLAAVETLVHLMQFPLTTIPGLIIPLDYIHIKQYKDNLVTSIDVLKVFVSRPGWVQKLIALWAQYEDEDLELVQE